MSDRNHIELNNKPQPQDQDLFHASCKFIEDTFHHPDARARQACAVADGCIVGGLKSIPDQVINHPAETLNQVVAGAGTGALFGMASKIKSPVVAGLVAVGGTAMTLGYVWDLGHRLGQNRDLQSSLDNIWRNDDRKLYASSMPTIENSLGKESFNFALATLSAGAGAKAMTLAADRIGPIVAPRQPCLEGAPNAMAEDIPLSTAKPDSSLAMVWYRDREGYVWDRIEPQALTAYIKTRPLSQRLDKIGSLIDAGQLFKAFDYAGANVVWHQERSSLPVDMNAQLAQHFHNIAKDIRQSWDEPNAGWLDKARNEIAITRDSFSDSPDWPLKIARDKVTNIDRLYSIPLRKRVDEIKVLADNHMFREAARLANMNYILHRNPIHSYWGSALSGSDNMMYNPEIADRFDTLCLHFMRMYKPSLRRLLPQTSGAEINDQLAHLLRM